MKKIIFIILVLVLLCGALFINEKTTKKSTPTIQYDKPLTEPKQIIIKESELIDKPIFYDENFEVIE